MLGCEKHLAMRSRPNWRRGYAGATAPHRRERPAPSGPKKKHVSSPRGQPWRASSTGAMARRGPPQVQRAQRRPSRPDRRHGCDRRYWRDGRAGRHRSYRRHGCDRRERTLQALHRATTGATGATGRDGGQAAQARPGATGCDRRHRRNGATGATVEDRPAQRGPRW